MTHDSGRATFSRSISKIRTLMPQALLKDQHFVQNRLKSFQQKRSDGMDKKRLFLQLAALEKRLNDSLHKRHVRIRNKPAVRFPTELPITAKSQDMIQAIKTHQVVIISGETGCGKSTQIPKMCLEAGLGIYGQIACTQPRRIAATSIARRIAEELGEELGRSVGYKIRFQDRTPEQAYIKIMTDGMLLAETQGDPLLYTYDTLIIDEAHERSLNIDFLLGIARTLMDSRPELKLIITSATLDTQKFSEAFNNAPVIQAGGKMFPIEVEYRSADGTASRAADADYIGEAVKTVRYLKSKKPPGDTLIFMPTEQDILETCRKLEGRRDPGVTVLPLYARLPGSQQGRIYSTKGPKIVIATNIAETSLTIPGIKYVIDTGLARISRYLAATRTNSLPVSPISQASADQRKGRCGRVQKGLCIRLYPQEDYDSRNLFTTPEILRSNLAEVILRMIALKLGHPSVFPFVDRPLPKNIKDGYDTLLELGAIERQGREYSLTPTGHLMARMPLDPRISRMLIEAHKEGFVNEVAVIGSALSIRDPRERPPGKETLADQMHAPFNDPDSDFTTLLNIWNSYHSQWKKLSSQNKKRKFCKEHYLSFPRMREWAYIYDQIQEILKGLRIPSAAASQADSAKEMRKKKKKGKEKDKSPYAAIHRSILSGYLANIAVHKEKQFYTAARGREAMIFPGSALFKKPPAWIVASEYVKTSRLFARMTARIDPAWLEALGGRLCRYSHSNPHWDKKRGEVMAEERVTLYGLEIISKRPVSFKRIDPDEAHKIFIHSACVEDNIEPPPGFIRYNQSLLKKLASMENKLRRRDILLGENTQAEFYADRLEGISDVRSLESLIKQKGNDNFLKMTEKDLLNSLPSEEDLALYPDQVALGSMKVKASYTFAPGEEEDGITLKIPARAIAAVPETSLDWSVPGFFQDKVAAMVKGLPKRYRKQLVPAAEKVNIIIHEMKRQDKALPNALAEFVRNRFRVDIPAKEWARAEIPKHLKLRLALVDTQGRELQTARSLEALKTARAEASLAMDPKAWTAARKKWEYSGLTTWDFDKLPVRIPIGDLEEAYPAFEPAEGTVNIRLFKNRILALKIHKLGVQALLLKKYVKDLDFAGRYLSLPEETEQAALYFGGKPALEKGLYENLKKEIFQKDLRSRSEFTAYSETIVRALFEKGHILRKETISILASYSKARKSLQETEKANPSSKIVARICSQIRGNLEALVPKNFPALYSLDRLKHIPRYVDAMRIRAERGSVNPEKDRQKASQAAPFKSALQQMQSGLPPSVTFEKQKALSEFHWMLEEFQVALFAPELKTSMPVSAKRLRLKMKEIERMI